MIVIIIYPFNHNEFMGLRHAARSQFGIENEMGFEKENEMGFEKEIGSEMKVEYRRCLQKAALSKSCFSLLIQ
ncbi:TPA: hypothetical protein P0E26_002405 [Vibrio harveyi]|nr:hypothetical protein [Vibrio harveyi]